MMFARIAINIPSDNTFLYAVPDHFRNTACVGKRALVPFGRRRTTGYILELTNVVDIEETKDIIDILDHDPLFGTEDLRFYRWMSEYYMHPLGKCLKTILPSGIDTESNMWLSPAKVSNDAGEIRLTPVRKKIIQIIGRHPLGLSLKKVQKELDKNNIYDDIKILQRAQLIDAEDRIKKPDIKKKQCKIVSLTSEASSLPTLTEKQNAIVDTLRRRGPTPAVVLNKTCGNVSSTIRTLEKKGLVETALREVFRSPDNGPPLGHRTGEITLTEEQHAALEEITAGLTSESYSPYLLHGVTGSGKTEIYFRAMEEMLATGGSAIYLVPEIALTPQLLSRIRERFDNNDIAVLHSGISQRSKYDEWRRIQGGDARIVIGARSAIFAPTVNLRLIIVDEEHESSYKQDDRLTYNACNLAIVKGKLHNATVILGSATPELQTYYNAHERDFRYLSLTKRIDDRPLPLIKIVDMKDQRDHKGTMPIISRTLKDAIAHTLGVRQQTLLFLNRRGFTTFVYCRDCGYTFKCVNCSVSMTHHSHDNVLKCHYCDYIVPAPPLCPSCHGHNVNSYGTGTEKVEEEIKTLFPEARVERMDSDTTRKRGAYARILKAFEKGTIDILIGTQMIAKGHDYPNVTLVGVISADTSLNLPDFRAAERTFQLLTQVAGRGGRGETPGKVIIQTFNPEHYAITRAHHHDCLGFYADELSIRKDLCYPPFSRMVNFRISGPTEERVKQCAQRLAHIARELSQEGNAGSRVRIMGPAEAPIAKIKGRHRWHMLLVSEDVKSLRRLTRDILSHSKKESALVKVDVDPVNFL